MPPGPSSSALRARLLGVPPLRWSLTRPPVEWLVATVNRSTVVCERARFLAREILRRPVLAAYRLRSGECTVFVRHASPDVVTLDEVFLSGDYRLPAGVESGLRRLQRPPAVLDLGANVGYFGAFMATRFPGVRVVAVEPDSENLQVLRRLIVLNDWDWDVVPAAAAAEAGEADFLEGAFSLSRLRQAAVDGPPPGSRVRQVPVVDVLPRLAQVDLAKVDIEGGEWAILDDRRFPEAAPAAFVLEYHPGLCPDPDPSRAARARLAAAGYEVEATWERNDGHGVLWGWKPS
jgi:FkbM family methyltransferase